jgi:hypothetical protein
MATLFFNDMTTSQLLPFREVLGDLVVGHKELALRAKQINSALRP